MKYLPLFLLLLIPTAFAFQQGHMVFDLDGWEIEEQRSAVQSFVKGSWYLEARAANSILTAEEFATQSGGEWISYRLVGDIREDVVQIGDSLYFLAQQDYKDTTYILLASSPAEDFDALQKEMDGIYTTLSFSTTSKVVQAPWEKGYALPERPSFFERTEVSWGWVILCGLVVLMIGLVVMKKGSRKKSVKKQAKVKKAAPKS